MRGFGELLALFWVLQWMLAAANSSGDAFVAKCRVQCAKKLTSDGSKASCFKQEECLRCWASCQAFQRDHYIKEYCKLNKACSAGCRQACDFYLTSASGRRALSGPTQLTSRTRTAPEAMSAVSAQPGMSAMDGEAAPVTPLHSSLPSEPRGKTSSSGLQDHKARWRPHLSELLPGSPLVTATLTWRSRGQGASYLVTWELRSGGLRGHLVSEEPRVSLSLWPNEDYVVQVFVGEDASEPLFVSTKSSPPVQEELAEPPMWTVVVSAVGLACLAAAVVGCCALACHQRRRRSANYLLPLEDGREERGVRTLLWRNRTVGGVLRPPGKAVAAARLAPLFVISHARR